MRQSARGFHANLLSDPTHCLASYCCEGILTLESGAAADCRFAAAQLRNGEVVLLCDFGQSFDLQPGVRTQALKGKTREGHQVRAGQGLVSAGGFDSELRDETLCGEWAVILARDLSVQHT